MLPSPAPRRILLADADAFFVAVARQEDPDGAGRAPLLIVGGRPGSRGVVCSASYECRRFGVRSAMPIARALALCPDALCVPVPRAACSRRSREIARVLHAFAPLVQASSIDEWYLDLSGTEALYRGEPLAETARRIRDAVRVATGLDVSIGGGTSRLVAKMAVEEAKPSRGAGGVHCVPPGGETAYLARFRLADLPMVGPRLAERLSSLGLVAVTDAQQAGEAALVRALGDRAGRWLHARVHGIDPSPVEPRGRPISVSREDTFARDLEGEELLERELLRLAVRVSADLRAQGLEARTVTVKLRTRDFRTRTAQRALALPIVTEQAVFRVARALLRRLRREHAAPVRLLGIALSQLAGRDAEATQLGLFDTAPATPSAPESGAVVEGERDRKLSQALDRIRERYGARAIGPATLADRRRDAGPRVEEDPA
jgi:DNA polymerase-4